MKEQIIAILRKFKEQYRSLQSSECADEIMALFAEPMLTEERYTAKDVDMAYIIGAFNSAKLDGLGDELKRLKELNKKPHEIVDEIRNRMSKPNTGGEKK